MDPLCDPDSLLALPGGGVVDTPGVKNIKIVASLSLPNTPRRVILLLVVVCLPVIVLVINKLELYVCSFDDNLTKQLEHTFPHTVGRQPKQVKRKRKPVSSRSLDEYDDPLQSDTSKDEFVRDDQLSLCWLEGEWSTVCYGCGAHFRTKPSDPPPPPSYDIMLKGKGEYIHLGKSERFLPS